jgi:DNA polymerase-3 subunit delta
LVNYRFDLIAKKIVADLSDQFLVANLSKERLEEDKHILADEFFSLPMFGGRKLIVIKDAGANEAEALKMLFEGSDSAKKSENFILVASGDLDKTSSLRKFAEANSSFAAIACYEDDEFAIKRFIESELTKRQIKSSPQVVELLLEKFGQNRQIILSELQKILVFLGEQKNLNIDLVNKISASEGEISIDKFVMNFAAQKFDLALLQSEKLFRDGFEPIALIRFLSNYLQKLYAAKVEVELKISDFENAVKSQRLFFKIETEFRKHLKNLSLDFLIKNLQNLANLEVKIKSGITLPKLLFVSFVQDCLKQKLSQ